MTSQGFIPPHGHYQSLLSYRKAEIVYDITFHFCRRFLTKGDRTIDQMIQAARSGKQNIVEGSAASGTSKEMEIKLTSVARASLEELLVDYKDFLRVRGMPLWDKDSKEALFVRRLGRSGRKSHGTDGTDGTNDAQRPHESYETYREFVETRSADVVANIAICLIHQASYLLDRQLQRLEADFLKHGGVRERMTRARLRSRGERG
ncbi:MAG: four helix bundle protein [Phycisphaeraceae bacterium]|nr:MAG: four helix bundle protein [Phycisphaeraceae bacterium]